MKILSIETSCDETGIALLESSPDRTMTLLGNALASQIELHAQYGGVFPTMAKRAHVEKIVFLIHDALAQSEILEAADAPKSGLTEKLSFLDEKESALKEHLIPFLTYYKRPDIDYIAVTVGPGLEPALWVGINAARAISVVWDIPLIPINHMEGHIVTPLFNRPTEKCFVQTEITYPILALLVSGGHTELVLSEQPGAYTKIGQTRDDAVGEAFDKVARMLGLPYPGGPAISTLAHQYRSTHLEVGLPSWAILPRPMLHSGDYDFSFSGIKTATLYAIRDLGRPLTEDDKMALAAAFEDAVVEVLIKKTLKAAEEYNTPTIIAGGGVASNTYLRSEFQRATAARKDRAENMTVLFPEPWLATDNAVMIGLAAMVQVMSGEIKTSAPEELRADGNQSIENS